MPYVNWRVGQAGKEGVQGSHRASQSLTSEFVWSQGQWYLGFNSGFITYTDVDLIYVSKFDRPFISYRYQSHHTSFLSSAHTGLCVCICLFADPSPLSTCYQAPSMSLLLLPCTTGSTCQGGHRDPHVSLQLLFSSHIQLAFLSSSISPRFPLTGLPHSTHTAAWNSKSNSHLQWGLADNNKKQCHFLIRHS